MTHKDFLKSLSSADKAALTERSNAAGLRHLMLHAGLIVFCGFLIALKVPFWWMLIVPQGILIAFLFTLQHEATHKTPFANEHLNEWVGWTSGLLIFQPFLWFRYFHLMHHRYTNDPANDPELAGLPKPENWPDFLWHLSSIGYWRDKVHLFWSLCFGTIDAPYLPKRVHPRLRREASGMLVIYALALVFTLFVKPVLFWVWILPLALGFPVLRLYLLAEHGRCPTVANMFNNTRTTYTNRIVRFVAWNMPYHIEHHTYPQVPFHMLPAFNAKICEHLGVTSLGYGRFTRDLIVSFNHEST
ncbi:MAG: fatty acid desaturase [Paracoccaceae bacterium]|nr:fatty acid desaturase [Paracoccaceae bacterium]